MIRIAVGSQRVITSGDAAQSREMIAALPSLTWKRRALKLAFLGLAHQNWRARGDRSSQELEGTARRLSIPAPYLGWKSIYAQPTRSYFLTFDDRVRPVRFIKAGSSASDRRCFENEIVRASGGFYASTLREIGVMVNVPVTYGFTSSDSWLGYAAMQRGQVGRLSVNEAFRLWALIDDRPKTDGRRRVLPVHGDFTTNNVLRTAAGLVVLDLEYSVDEAPRLVDPIALLTQNNSRRNRGRILSLIRSRYAQTSSCSQLPEDFKWAREWLQINRNSPSLTATLAGMEISS